MKVLTSALLQLLIAVSVAAADRDRLLFHAETIDGTVIASRRPDVFFNPASVVKVGTSLWALEILGFDHRYPTIFGTVSRVGVDGGTLDGDLVVMGGGDPDFHLENAFMVARGLNRLGIRRVTGDLVVDGSFLMGWENGVEGRTASAVERAQLMGRRLSRALDSASWDPATATAWHELCVRRDWQEHARPRVVVSGGVQTKVRGEVQPVLTHLSNPLHVLLKRFNTYSNNDLIRIAAPLGGAPALQAFLRERLGESEREVELSTASGQSRNRMTARGVVELMRQFQYTAKDQGLEVGELLPIPGCDPGPTRQMFPLLVSGEHERTLVCKTGTLTTTDGGVVVLAGYIRSLNRGVVLFCVAAPRTGYHVTHWRRIEQEWILDLVDTLGGAVPFPCSAEFPYSDSFAAIHTEKITP
jgi:D-alanyl-D-alanine carboxypeptidase/D-alanyl-D-alanine-endopeptidase (penicillin-binding protein 4)